MSFLKNAKLSIKIGSIIVALALVSIGLVVYLTSTIRSVDASYSELLDKRSQGLLLASRANVRVQEVAHEAYKVMLFPGASTEAKQAAKEYGAALDRFQELIGKAESLLPIVRPALAAVRQRVTELSK